MSDYAPIVTVTPTIMDGVVVRWHKTLYQVEAVEPIVSASRNAVIVHRAEMRRIEDIEDFEAVFNAACDAHRALAAGRPDDVKHLATHRTDGFMGPLVPVDREQVQA